eukprot:CAMPEP_0168330054 /NCGR_PEP_ID=MMETSP0213-20121227/7481_1 /TAXON_ID=151035 /ORGANISM="Euplotes harpa, Strain FSP1.4" /LENGTH=539 /DNA_ID=CAMNT_0008333509 /DNA_START=20 /DNA_END=1639 /DNA_ORIENTATION=-
MEDLEDFEVFADINSWGPAKALKNAKNAFGQPYFAMKPDAKSNNKYIKGLCEVFLREKKGEEKERDTTVTFEVVEVKQQAKKKITGQRKYVGQRNTYNNMYNQNWMDKNKGNRQTGKKKKDIKKSKQLQQINNKNEMKAKAKRYKDMAVKISENWKQIDEFSSLILNNLPKFIPGANQVIGRGGKIGEYRIDLDSVSNDTKVPFTPFKEIATNRLSTNSIILDEFIADHVEEIKGTKIIASDMVIATLMNFSKSVYSWDIKVEKFGDLIYLDKRDIEDGNDEYVSVDLESVGENSSKPPQADAEVDSKSTTALPINTALSLMKEATKIMHSVQNVCVSKDSVQEFDLKHPAQEDEDQTDLPLQGYTYMEWPFGKGRTLITRGQLHSFMKKDNDDVNYCNIYAMNQWRFTKAGWSNIDTEKTSIFSQELTDNTNRVSKWAIQSMLAGADIMKILFVARQKILKNDKHYIMSTSTISTQKFVDLISLRFEDAWSKVKYIVDYLEDKEDGVYMLVKDPIKSSLKVFFVPQDIEEQDDEEKED